MAGQLSKLIILKEKFSKEKEFPIWTRNTKWFFGLKIKILIEYE
jgi:hypothetical protein